MLAFDTFGLHANNASNHDNGLDEIYVLELGITAGFNVGRFEISLPAGFTPKGPCYMDKTEIWTCALPG